VKSLVACNIVSLCIELTIHSSGTIAIISGIIKSTHINFIETSLYSKTSEH